MFFYRTKLWNRDSGFYSCVVTKLMNSSSYSITAYSISCNTDSYYSVITIIAYQTSSKPNKLNPPFFFFFVILYSSFIMNTLEKIPKAATGRDIFKNQYN